MCIRDRLCTETKIFCGCKNAFGAEVNTLCCPVCMGTVSYTHLDVYKRQMPVYIKFDSTGQRVRAPRNLWCIPNELLLRELERILGKGNVVLKQ